MLSCASFQELHVNEVVDRAIVLTTEKNTNYVMRIQPFMLLHRLNQALFFGRKEYASHIFQLIHTCLHSTATRVKTVRTRSQR